jgi:hypothetical protein
MDTTSALNPEDMSVDDFIAEAEAELAALEPRYRAMTAGQRRDEEARLEQAASGGEPEAQTALSGWRAVGQMVTALEPIHQARLRYAAEQAAEDALSLMHEYERLAARFTRPLASVRVVWARYSGRSGACDSPRHCAGFERGDVSVLALDVGEPILRVARDHFALQGRVSRRLVCMRA